MLGLEPTVVLYRALQDQNIDQMCKNVLVFTFKCCFFFFFKITEHWTPFMSVNQHKEAQMTNKQYLQWLRDQFW